VNSELEAYDYLMDPTASPAEPKRKGPNKFEKLGINFDPKYPSPSFSVLISDTALLLNLLRL
jgi:hypothetical protein